MPIQDPDQRWVWGGGAGGGHGTGSHHQDFTVGIRTEHELGGCRVWSDEGQSGDSIWGERTPQWDISTSWAVVCTEELVYRLVRYNPGHREKGICKVEGGRRCLKKLLGQQETAQLCFCQALAWNAREPQKVPPAWMAAPRPRQESTLLWQVELGQASPSSDFQPNVTFWLCHILIYSPVAWRRTTRLFQPRGYMWSGSYGERNLRGPICKWPHFSWAWGSSEW